MSPKIKFIDLFCGMGGFRIALEKHGCKCVFSSDIDKYARDTYQLNFGEIPYGDITKIKSEDIPNFNILCAGFPCQPFSIAGKRLGFEDTRGTLFFEVARIIKDKKPDAFFLENVRGLINHNNGNTLKIILKTLDELGYYVEWKVLNAKKFGVPQNRERWYCVGFNKQGSFFSNSKKFIWPEEEPLKITLDDIIGVAKEETYLISDTCNRNIQKYVLQKNIKVNKSTLAYEIRPSRCQFATEKISPCLTAKMGTGGNNIPVVISQKRKLTEKECLKIMGYPETYRFFNGYHTYKQIGNSVVVPILDKIANNILTYLAKEDL